MVIFIKKIQAKNNGHDTKVALYPALPNYITGATSEETQFTSCLAKGFAILFFSDPYDKNLT